MKAAWVRADQVDRLGQILDYAEQAVPLLVEPDAGESEGQSFFTRLKFVTETCLLLYAADRTADPALSHVARRVAQQLAPHARHQQLLTWVRLRPGLLAELTVAHFCLSRLGLGDSEFDRQLEALARMSSVGARERIPWKDLEDSWHCELGACSPPIDRAAALRRTSISQVQDAIFATREDGYAFTHALIYATDFGHRPYAGPRPAGEILLDASSLLARCLDEDDFDLGAEVVMSWPMLRAPWSPLAQFSYRLFHALSTSVGILPSMTLRADEYYALDGSAARRYFYREGYHTAYVMGLLIAVTLLPDAAPTGSWRARDSDHGSVADSLYALLPQREVAPQWQAHFERLDADEREALAPFVADVLVRRAIKRADYALLREALSLYLATGHALVPGVIQGAELLARMAMAAEAL